MNHCEAFRDRMVSVAHGRATWQADEVAHLRACTDCAAEWRLVQRGTTLGQRTVVDVDAVASKLRGRLRHEPVVLRAPMWRPVRVAALAIAASIALFFVLPFARQATPVSNPAAPAIVAVLPELDQLSEDQLEAVLTEISVSDGDLSPMRLPRIGDLTEHQLELVLQELEG